jgi:malate permease and related proteins
MDKILLITGTFCLAMALRAAGLIRDKHLDALVRFVITIALPCLTLTVIGSLSVQNAHFDIAVIAWLIMTAGAALAFAVGKLARFESKKLRAFVLAAAFPNTAFLGYPISYALFGSTGLSYAVIYDQLGMFPLFLSLGFFIAGGRESLLQGLKFPPFIALLAALALNLLGFSLITPVGTVLSWVGWTTLPLTIFLIGARIRLRALRDCKTVSWCLLIKMIIMPGLLFAALQALGYSGLPYQVTLLETAMPPALITSIIARQFQLDEDLTIACISVGTVLGMVVFTGSTLLSFFLKG